MAVLIFTDFQIIVSILMSICAWKWGGWRQWRLYYPTIQFYIIGAFLCSLLTYNHPLWEYESPLLKTTFSDVLITLVFVPASILIYLHRFPKKNWKKQGAFILLWVGVYTLIEWISYGFGFFSYYNGWTIWLSLLFNCTMFPLLWLHSIKPLWAVLLLFAYTTAGIIIFQIPLGSMK